jgi:hypothetical protein
MPRKKKDAAPTTRSFKWIGLGDSEYVTRCGTFMVQLRDKLWHLHRRVEISEPGLPSWTWSESLIENKRKGACQDAAESDPQADVPDVVRVEAPRAREQARDTDEDADDRERPALSNLQHGGEEHNASCWCCGVRFTRKPKWKFGMLCGVGCMDTMIEILDECEAMK